VKYKTFSRYHLVIDGASRRNAVLDRVLVMIPASMTLGNAISKKKPRECGAFYNSIVA
jgi:hypothetical protein